MTQEFQITATVTGIIDDVTVFPKTVIFAIKPEHISGENAQFQPYFYKNKDGHSFVVQTTVDVAGELPYPVDSLKGKGVTLNMLEGNTPELTITETGDKIDLIVKEK
jgi:hypothetical protein